MRITGTLHRLEDGRGEVRVEDVYATDPEILAQYPHGDIQLDRIADLVKHDLSQS